MTDVYNESVLADITDDWLEFIPKELSNSIVANEISFNIGSGEVLCRSGFADTII
jgi:hypothetical protein